MEKASMYIFGMSCAGCVASVKMALEDVPGVKHAAVDLEQCMAVVEYEAPATAVSYTHLTLPTSDLV